MRTKITSKLAAQNHLWGNKSNTFPKWERKTCREIAVLWVWNEFSIEIEAKEKSAKCSHWNICLVKPFQLQKALKCLWLHVWLVFDTWMELIFLHSYTKSYFKLHNKYYNKPRSYSRYWSRTGLQPRLMQEVLSNGNSIYSFLMILPCISKLVSPTVRIQIWSILLTLFSDLSGTDAKGFHSCKTQKIFFSVWFSCFRPVNRDLSPVSD